MAKSDKIVRNPTPKLSRVQIGNAEYTVQLEQLNVKTAVLGCDPVSDKIKQFGRAAALKYLSLQAFAGERSIKESHLQRLLDRMRRGVFNQNTVIVATASYGGVTYMINAQHTAAVVKIITELLDKKFKLRVRVQHYRVKTLEQLRLLYSTFDVALPRTVTHNTLVQLVETPEMRAIPVQVIQRMGPGVRRWLYEGRDERRLDHDQLAMLIRRDHLSVFRDVASVIKPRILNVEFLRAPVIAAMLATFDKSAKAAREFWIPVLDGTGLSKRTDARLVLREMLQNFYLLERGRRRYSLPPEDVFRICTQAWNKWRDNEPVATTIRATKARVKVK